jgi:DNA-binding transcriptional MerR regulator
MIPSKSNFKFQELTPITGVKPYVLRFWEAEFEEINPVTSDSGQKLYARKDVELILKIKKLLFEDKLSIPEAKAALRGQGPVSVTTTAPVSKHDRPSFPVDEQAIKAALSLLSEIKNRHGW